jgi:phage baseplate assembly protein W
LSKFLGIPYPVRKTAKGFFCTTSGINQIKSDILILLYTEPGERVMLPNFGTPLRQLAFDQNDSTIQFKAKNIISTAIKKYEPRVVVTGIDVSNVPDPSILNPLDDGTQTAHILSIKILFVLPQNQNEVQQLVLEVPLGDR